MNDATEKLHAWVKTAKSYDENQLVVLRRKGISLFMQTVKNTEKPDSEVNTVDFESVLPLVECEPSTPKEKTSKYFWDNYEKIKAYKPKFKTASNESSLEIKALNNLKSALRIYEESLEEHVPFIRGLIEDLRDYLTLSKFTLRKLTQHELTQNSPKKDIGGFVKVIYELKHYLGEGYLETIKDRSSAHAKEIIIGIENILND